MHRVNLCDTEGAFDLKFSKLPFLGEVGFAVDISDPEFCPDCPPSNWNPGRSKARSRLPVSKLTGTFMKWLIRIFWVACLAVLSLVMLAFLLVQFQQNLLRWRAERLMADMHRIRLYQSNWDDAQRLMSRLGCVGSLRWILHGERLPVCDPAYG